MSPGDVFVVGDVVGEASVEDADESVAEGAEGLVVGVVGRSTLVVVAACSGRSGERGEGPQVDRIGESLVADMPGENNAFGARRPGDG